MTHLRALESSGLMIVMLCLGGNARAGQDASMGPPKANPQEASMAATVADNMDIGMEYTLSVDGKVVDSTQEKGTFHYVHGHGQIVPALEHQLAGLHIGENKEVTLGPEDGYGIVDPAAFIEVPKAQLPQDVVPEVGMVLRGVNPDGKSFRATVTEVKAVSVVLNLNHPLAGKTLNFKVKIVEIAPAKAS